MFKLLDIDLESHIKDMLFDEVSGNIRLQMTLVSLKILFNEIKPYYKTLKIPEFDVGQLKEVIQKAIEEFKKSLPGCDDAFSKLLKSLDTFSGNFDQYYEQFQLTNREPASFFMNFIEDVQQQYQHGDTEEYRTLIR